jgi:hypothetical protein
MGHDDRQTANLDKHTDEELRQGIRRADEQEPRVAAEDSEGASQAQRSQRDHMERELQRREEHT